MRCNAVLTALSLGPGCLASSVGSATFQLVALERSPARSLPVLHSSSTSCPQGTYSACVSRGARLTVLGVRRRAHPSPGALSVPRQVPGSACSRLRLKLGAWQFTFLIMLQWETFGGLGTCFGDPTHPAQNHGDTDGQGLTSSTAPQVGAESRMWLAGKFWKLPLASHKRRQALNLGLFGTGAA